MRTIAFRAAVTLVALASIALAGAAGVRADFSLGATIQSRVYISDGRALQVWNRSTVPATFTFATGGEWATDPSSVTLDADEVGSATSSATARTADRCPSW